jgi:hypothetical protein
VQQSLFGAFVTTQSIPPIAHPETNLLQKSPDYQDLNADESESESEDLIDGSRRSSEENFE